MEPTRTRTPFGPLRHRSWPRLLGAILTTATALLGLGPIALGAAPAAATGYSPQVDPLVPYQGQYRCVDHPQAGTQALAAWLLRKYPVTGSLGMMRGCDVGGTSEHKDGRAFDWAADVRNTAQRKAAYDFIRTVLAPDSRGNTHALARRLGIMYFIYNDHIWSASHDFVRRDYLHSGCTDLASCPRTLRHKDHVHISLGYAGAYAQTSWYRARNVRSHPVLHPGTRVLDADQTAVVRLRVPADGSMVRAPFQVVPGVTYRIVAIGEVNVMAHKAGDANCVQTKLGWLPTPRGDLIDPNPTDTTGGTGGWGDSTSTTWGGWGLPEGSTHLLSRLATPATWTRGLAVDGRIRWERPARCRADHAYQGWFTPNREGRLRLQFVDFDTSDNSGELTVYVARDDITLRSLVRG